MKNKMKNKINVLYVITFSLVILFYSGVMAQTEESTPTATPAPTPNVELMRLEEEKKAAELRRDKLKAEREALETQFPKPSVTPLQGTTKISGVFIESEIITNFALSQAARELVNQFKSHSVPIKKIAIYSEKDLQLLQSYVATQKRIEALKKAYNRALPENKRATRALVDPINIGASVVGSFVNLLSLFRTDTEITGQPFKIAENGLVNEVFKAIKESGTYAQTALYHPATFQPNLKQNFAILGEIDAVYELKAKADEIIEDFEATQKKIAKAKSNIATLETLIEKKREKIEEFRDSIAKLDNEGLEKNIKLIRYYEGKLLKLNQDIDEAEKGIEEGNEVLQATTSASEEEVLKLKSVNLQFDQFIASLTTSSDPTGINLITALLRAENINTALAGEDTYWLQLQTVSAGGNNRIKTNLLKNVFTGSDLSHSGGVIITYNLFDSTKGCSVSSGEIVKYIQYMKSNKIMSLATTRQTTSTQQQRQQSQQTQQNTGAVQQVPITVNVPPICSETEQPAPRRASN